jgi:hypothetical protein
LFLSAAVDYRCNNGVHCDASHTKTHPSAKLTAFTSTLDPSSSQCAKDSETDHDWELEEIFTRGCHQKALQQHHQQLQQQHQQRRQCASSGRWRGNSIDEGFLEDCPEPVQFSSAPPEGLLHCFTLSPQAFLAYSNIDIARRVSALPH